MPVTVEIDKQSGFCGGVIRAIGKAEDFLDSNEGKSLYSLGAIVHNEAELERLGKKGLITIGHKDMADISTVPGSTLFIRAHGEPPQTYSDASALGLSIIDCTCPVVLKLQKDIKQAYANLHEGGKDGQLIIFGKIGHAEVLGLLGQVGGDALVIENMAQFQQAIQDGRINLDIPTEIFSQTTKSPTGYEEICSELQRQSRSKVEVHNTICRQVASRHAQLSEFAMNHDIIIFVAGKASSNGQVLCNLCRASNERTYHIGEASELQKDWFRDGERVGICGATSTPKWLLDQVAEKILQGI